MSKYDVCVGNARARCLRDERGVVVRIECVLKALPGIFVADLDDVAGGDLGRRTSLHKILE